MIALSEYVSYLFWDLNSKPFAIFFITIRSINVSVLHVGNPTLDHCPVPIIVFLYIYNILLLYCMFPSHIDAYVVVQIPTFFLQILVLPIS